MLQNTKHNFEQKDTLYHPRKSGKGVGVLRYQILSLLITCADLKAQLTSKKEKVYPLYYTNTLQTSSKKVSQILLSIHQHIILQINFQQVLQIPAHTHHTQVSVQYPDTLTVPPPLFSYT